VNAPDTGRAPDAVPSPAQEPVTLDNCDREPIHVPGSVQPHGALLAFDAAGALVTWSDNVAALTGLAPGLGVPMSSMAWPDEVGEAADMVRADMQPGDPGTLSGEATMNGRRFDYIVHAHADRVLVEFEQRELDGDAVAGFALKAHRAIDRLKRQRQIEPMLQKAVEEVRALTGFDRVMAYRFRHDDSGDVVAEAADAALDPFLGRRYPASDIPAQARRLYTINTLRLIADVSYAPVPLLAAPDESPLDLSHSVLRSVSPVHVEYLQNMGVGASMSVSIVVGGRLWGLIACHHNAPRQVPYSVRMACDVIAQVIGATVQTLTAQAHAAQVEAAASLRTQLMETLLNADDVLRAVAGHTAGLREIFGADALVVSHFGKLDISGDVPAELVAEIVASLPPAGAGEHKVRRTRIEDWPEAMQPRLGPWVGLLAMCFDEVESGWIIALRLEQVETVRWGGRPEKHIAHGPLGPRLTPRGSFEEWRETVRGAAEPWSATERQIARELMVELMRASNARHAETDRARNQLLAMLGHDLRDPLNSISMAARVLERGDDRQHLGERIRNSSSRMQRLVSHVLDLSRLKSGLGLGLHIAPIDLRRLLEDLVDESRLAHPGVDYQLDLADNVVVQGDGDRIAQVLGNLISNARHHGELGRPVTVRLYAGDGVGVAEVRNEAPPIPEAAARHLFEPFKAQSAQNLRNRSGLGMGLYIAHEIALAHRGRLSYRYELPEVVFAIELPMLAAAPPGHAPGGPAS